MNEFQRIEALRTRLERSRSDIHVSIGDDAAVLRLGDADAVLSVDAQVENVHFRRAWLSLRQIGHRAYVSATSDLAAMGAEPRAAVVALILPPSLSDAEFLELIDAMAQAADDYNAPVVGGNLAAGEALSITTTVVGTVQGAPLRRGGAKAGDIVYTTGPVGRAALGLAWLQTGRSADAAGQLGVAHWRCPAARIDVGVQLRGVATAAIDLSDGLVQDLGHICVASLVGARIQLAAVPRINGFEDSCAGIGIDPTRLLLGGGEEYELIFTAAPGSGAERFGTQIGEIVAGPPGVTVLDAHSNAVPIADAAAGYRHFE